MIYNHHLILKILILQVILLIKLRLQILLHQYLLDNILKLHFVAIINLLLSDLFVNLNKEMYMFKKILFFIFITQLTYSQDRQLIQGKVIYRNIDVPAANVINNTDQSSTITNDQGEFEIFAKEGDEIIFSSVQYIIRTVRVNKEILKNKRLVVQINERVRELDEVVITPDDTQKFLDLKEEQFKGFDYVADKSTKIQNVLTDNRQVVNGLNFVNIFKLLSTIVDSKSDVEKLNIVPSEVLPYILEENFFSDVLKLETFEINDFLFNLDSDEMMKSLILEKNQFLVIDYLINKADSYKDLKIE